jgi:hypothetical protein
MKLYDCACNLGRESQPGRHILQVACHECGRIRILLSCQEVSLSNRTEIETECVQNQEIMHMSDKNLELTNTIQVHYLSYHNIAAPYPVDL